MVKRSPTLGTLVSTKTKCLKLIFIMKITLVPVAFFMALSILTSKSNRSMVSFGRKHCKYDMHIYFHASFLGIAFKSFIGDKDYTAQSVCKNN